jgi:integrase/recombinase XerD
MDFANFDIFLNERRFLKNVSPRTVDFYGDVKRALERFHPDGEFTKQSLKRFVEAMREAGVKPVSCNTWISGVNAYLHWLFDEALIPQRLSIAKLKVEQRNVQTFNTAQLQRLLAWKPRRWTERRLYVLVAILLDTGLRIEEALTLHRAELDLDNLVLRVRGKGDKYRLVPLSVEGRRLLYRWLGQHTSPLVFPTRDGTRLKHRSSLRAFAGLCKKLGIAGPRCSFHTLRHTFATNYIRYGGDVFRLQRVLGHATLEMTRKYLDLQVSDLQAIHSGISLLGRL